MGSFEFDAHPKVLRAFGDVAAIRMLDEVEMSDYIVVRGKKDRQRLSVANRGIPHLLRVNLITVRCRMNYQFDVFKVQYALVTEFVHHLVYYRAIHAKMKKKGLKSAFWAACASANLLQASIKWCGVFGSHGANPTHWKRLAPGDSDKFRENFRSGLPDETGLTLKEWDAYGKEMRDFRNEYAAHRTLNPDMPVPPFDHAVKVAKYYDRWVRGIIDGAVIIAEPLKEVLNKAKLEADSSVDKAFAGFGPEE